MKFNLIKKFFIITIGTYIIIRVFSVPFANFMLALTVISLIPFMIYRLAFRDNFYKNSIKSVDKKFVAGNNTLANDYCTVAYTPDKTITVMENVKSKRRDKRMFTLTKQQLNINKAWYKLCRIFDFYTTIDLLKEFYDKETRVLMITLESKIPEEPEETVNQPKTKDGFVNMGTIHPDSFGVDFGKENEAGDGFVDMGTIHPDSFGADFGKENAAGDGFVSMDNLKTHNQQPPAKKEEQEPELAGMNDIMNKMGKKINVNAVEAGELAVLPGINIATAKKIVEYRNTNGNFKTSDEFLKVANVKEHFVQKIKEMIEVKEPSPEGQKNGYDSDNGRVVDF